MYQKPGGLLWLGTDRGVSQFNGHNFTNFTKSDNLGDNEIFSIRSDQQNRLWFLSNNGIPSHYDGKKFYQLLPEKSSDQPANIQLHDMTIVDDTLVVFPNRKGLLSGHLDQRIIKNNPAFSNQQVYKFWKTKTGVIFYLSSLGISKITTAGTHQMIHTFTKPLSFSKTSMDKQGTLLFTSKNQLIRFHPDRGLDTLVRSSTSGNNYISIRQLGEELWIGRRKGALRYHWQEDQLILKDSFLTHLSISAIERDFEGGYWFSTLTDGLWYSSNIDVQHFSTANNRPLPPIACLDLTKDGTIWMGGVEGFLGKFHAASNKITALDQLGKQLEINAILVDGSNTWIATNQHTFILNDQQRYPKRPGTIRTFLIDEKREKVLLGGTNGLWSIPFEVFYNQPPDSLNNSEQLHEYWIFRASVNKIFRDAKGMIWLGTNNGLFALNKGKPEFVKILNTSHPIVITDIISINDQLVLSTAGDGILLFGDSLQQLQRTDGLASDFCSGLFNDGSNRFFAGTTNGVSQIDLIPDGFSIRSTAIAGTTSITDLVADSAQIYLASSSGLSIVKKSIFDQINPAPGLQLREHQVNSQKNYPLNELTYRENNIQFNFTGFSFSSPDAVRLHYTLNDNWSHWQISKDQLVEFNALAPGTYELQVKACYQQGPSCSKTITIPFNIHPPFWKTWWFRLLIITVLLAIIYAFFHIRILTYNRDVVRELLKLLLSRLQRESFIIVKDVRDGSNAKVTLSSIKWIESNRNYLTLHLADRKLTTRAPLKELEETLQQQKKNACLRVHRSYIVNTQQIDAWHSSFVKIGDTCIPIGPNYKKDLEAVLD